MARSKFDPQDRAIKVIAALLQSQQGLLGLVKSSLPPHTPVNLRAADDAFAAGGLLLNDLRLGELKIVQWSLDERKICVECGNTWDGEEVECSECGGVADDI